MDNTYGITNTAHCAHGQHMVKAEQITWIITKNGRRRICEECKTKIEAANKQLRKGKS